MKLVTTEEMRQAEQAAVEAGATWEGLMDRAGRAVADQVLARLGKSGGAEDRRVLALVGPGNNGGDALVAGRYLVEAGLSVQAYLWNRPADQSDPLIEVAAGGGVRMILAEEDKDLRVLQQQLKQVDVVIDGLLGMGLLRPIEGRLRDIVEQVNKVEGPLVVAVDLPSGVQADTGQVLGVAIQAGVTVTMGQPKRGLCQFPGAGCAGEVVVAEIGIPESLLDQVQVELLDDRMARAALPGRPRDAHKGTFGRVLVVAGSLQYPGAPYLAAMAAYRVGAGLVTLAPPRSLYPILAARAVEATFLPLPDGDVGAIGEEAVQEIVEALPRYQALVLGCGLGQEEVTVTFVRRLLRTEEKVRLAIGFLPQGKEKEKGEWELPGLVLDADALNALAGVPEWWKQLPAGRVVLTPHPGEMARLLGASQEEVLASPIAVAQRAATTWGHVVVFKGANSVIGHPDGRVVLNPGANPALATAGTGDVLAGAIGGFLAQGVAPFEAALLGVRVHSGAGECLSADAGEAGGIASDLLACLPRVIRGIRGK